MSDFIHWYGSLDYIVSVLAGHSAAIHVASLHCHRGSPRHYAFAPFLEDDDPLSTSLSLRATARSNPESINLV